MRDDNKHENFIDQDDEFEEAPSLCDLPIYSCHDQHVRRDFDVDAEPFEFFSNMSAEIVPAEDIIIRGKIVPLKQVKRITHSSSANIFMRFGHSLDCNEFHGSSRSESPLMEGKRLGNERRKSWWYMWMFGFMKFQPVDQMLLKDVKNRQVRRNASSGGNKVPVRQNNGKRAWRLLRVLSCDHHIV